MWISKYKVIYLCSGRDREIAVASIMPSVIINFISFVIVYREFSNGLYLCLGVAASFPVALVMRIVCQQSYLETGECQSTVVSVLRVMVGLILFELVSPG